MDDELYKQNILDRYRHPRNKRIIPDADIRTGGVNASCGDSLMLYLSFDGDGTVEDASFEGEGCAISQAMADMLMGEVRGKAKQELAALSKKDVYDLLGFEVGSAREKCALLALEAIQSCQIFK